MYFSRGRETLSFCVRDIITNTSILKGLYTYDVYTEGGRGSSQNKNGFGRYFWEGGNELIRTSAKYYIFHSKIYSSLLKKGNIFLRYKLHEAKGGKIFLASSALAYS